MADRFPGEIHIGGTLCLASHEQEDVDLFLGQCSDQPIQWGERRNGDPLTLDTLDQVIDPATGWITFRDEQACCGVFEELEELCRRLDLPYDRNSDARYEYDGELARWRPGMESPLVELATQAGHPLVPRDRVEACLSLFQDGRVEDGIKALQELLPEVTPLPRFQLDPSGAHHPSRKPDAGSPQF